MKRVITCSGVTVTGLGMLEACVVVGVDWLGLGGPPVELLGARYFNIAGSTSGVPYGLKENSIVV